MRKCDKSVAFLILFLYNYNARVKTSRLWNGRLLTHG